MRNSSMLGYQDWNWRGRIGDWRFFMAMFRTRRTMPRRVRVACSYVVAEVGDPAEMHGGQCHTALRCRARRLLDFDSRRVSGPLASSRPVAPRTTNVDRGIWLPQTNTGTTEEWVAAPLGVGLNQIILHNVVWPGQTDTLPFSGEAGMASVAPSAIDIVDTADDGSEAIDFATTMELDGAAANAYGLSKRLEGKYSVQQDASWTEEFTRPTRRSRGSDVVCGLGHRPVRLRRRRQHDRGSESAQETSTFGSIFLLTTRSVEVLATGVRRRGLFDISVRSPHG